MFSSLVLIDPLIRLLVPIPRYPDLLSALAYLTLNIFFAYLSLLSSAGISVVAYHGAIGKAVDIKTAYQYSTSVFWRVVGVIFLLLIIISPCWVTTFIVSYKQPFQIVDLAHSFFLLIIFLSIFAAIPYFAITEIIANDTKIGRSLKVAWTVFTYNFLILAIIGLGLAVASYLTNVVISTVTMLMQNNFATLSKLDFISPQLSINDSNFYKLISALNQVLWRTFSTSVFTFAFLKFSGAKLNEHSRS